MAHAMRDNTLPEPIGALLALMQQMHEAARGGHWEHLSDADERRRTLLEQLAQVPQSAFAEVTVQQAVARILQLDKVLLALAGEQRDGLAREGRDFQRRRSVSNQYQQCQRGF